MTDQSLFENLESFWMIRNQSVNYWINKSKWQNRIFLWIKNFDILSKSNVQDLFMILKISDWTRTNQILKISDKFRPISSWIPDYPGFRAYSKVEKIFGYAKIILVLWKKIFFLCDNVTVVLKSDLLHNSHRLKS